MYRLAKPETWVRIPLLTLCLYGVIANIPLFQSGDVGAEPTIGLWVGMPSGEGGGL